MVTSAPIKTFVHWKFLRQNDPGNRTPRFRKLGQRYAILHSTTSTFTKRALADLLYCTIRRPSSSLGPPILFEKLPLEILRKILPLAASLSPCREAFVIGLCWVTHRLRFAAFSLPELWDHLSIVCTVYGGGHIQEAELDKMRWWATILFFHRNRDFHFGLRFEFRYPSKYVHSNIRSLDATKLQIIFSLLGHAKHLDTDTLGLEFLRTTSAGKPPFPLPLLKGIQVQQSYFGWRDPWAEGAVCNLVETFIISGIRSMNLCGYRLPCTNSVHFEFWSKLTHVSATFHTTLLNWKHFLRACSSLQGARITLCLLGKIPALPIPTDRVTAAPNLKEIDLNFDYMRPEAYHVFDGMQLPVLDTLIFRAQRATLAGAHRLLRATPALERFQIHCSYFPDTGEQDYPGRFPVTDLRLVKAAPLLKHILISVYSLPNFKISHATYVQQLEHSGWLAGRWENGPLHVDFYFETLPWDLEEWGVESFHELLSWPTGGYHFGEVVMGVRPRSPLWVFCHDF